MHRDIASNWRAILSYVRRLPGFIGVAIEWWAIRVYLSRLTRNFIPPPPTVPPCKWDPDLVPLADQTCDKQCTNPLYKGGLGNQAFINGKTWIYCCPKGYTSTGVNDPITGLATDVICKKDT